jgi:hypothetical protein
MSTTTIYAPDLTQHAPRSMRCTLGGYAILPRMLDKGRATIVGKNGEYHYACPLDQRFISFVGIDSDALKEQIALGKGDGEILEWIRANQKNPRSEWEIAQWSAFRLAVPPSAVEQREFFHGIHKEVAPHRDDIATWPDVLDLDDYVSFGGKA